MGKWTFRMFLTLTWVTAIAAVEIDLATRHTLPSGMREGSGPGASTLSESVFLAISIPIFALMLIGYIGLYLLKPWGRIPFLLFVMANYAYDVLLDPRPHAFSAAANAAYSLISIFVGITLAAIFFDPNIKRQFRRSNAPPEPLPESDDDAYSAEGVDD